MQGLLEELRLVELTAIRDWFTPNIRVLEIGGGSGFQAKVISSWGAQVMSIDLAERSPSESPYFPVRGYDGTHIPADVESFDLIFSSNVLEHVKNLPPLFSEMHRVLKPQGLAIHLLPTPAWRFWTSVTHYGNLLKLIGGARGNGSSINATGVSLDQSAQGSKRSWVQKLSRKMFAGPHGEYPNAASDLYYFSEGRWLKTFSENGLAVQQVLSTNLYYSGYALCPNLSMEMRRILSRYLGAACRVYIMTKATERSNAKADLNA
jgi:SAM-dependent methyltransferase